MLNIELAYDVAKAMGLEGDEFATFLDDCNNYRGHEWRDEVVDAVSEEMYNAWAEACSLSKSRVYQVSLDILAPEDIDILDLIYRLRTAIEPDECIEGWNQEVSWSLSEYRSGIK